jgi:excisionase family DNA binding protein
MTTKSNAHHALDEPLYTPTDVAALASLHPEVIRREIRRGNLRAHKVTGRLRISRSDYLTWLEHNRL